jgi:hypothetical protein
MCPNYSPHSQVLPEAGTPLPDEQRHISLKIIYMQASIVSGNNIVGRGNENSKQYNSPSRSASSFKIQICLHWKYQVLEREGCGVLWPKSSIIEMHYHSSLYVSEVRTNYPVRLQRRTHDPPPRVLGATGASGASQPTIFSN